MNVAVGSCLVELKKIDKVDLLDLNDVLIKIQNQLFNLGNMLAVEAGTDISNMPRINLGYIEELEKNINLYNKSLPELNSFVLPGGNELSIRFHLVRVKCRKVERFIVKILKEESIDIIIVKYLNRMSDLFFVLSRYCNCLLNNKEFTWDPNC